MTLSQQELQAALEKESSSKASTANKAKQASTNEPSVDDWQIHVFDQLPSTNDFLRHHDGESVSRIKQLCATDWQTAGHGRRGKGWQSQRGNVTFTLRQRLHQPAVKLLGLSLVTGIAVVSVLRTRLGVGVNLKWPNDVLTTEGQKLGGLLIELLPVAGDPNANDVLTGIGLNVRHQVEFDGLGIGATSFERLGVSTALDRHELIAAISDSVARHYVEFETSGWSVFESRWQKVDALFGQQVNVSGHKAFTGKACGVNSHGALCVQTESGVEEVMAGEVSVRPV